MEILLENLTITRGEKKIVENFTAKFNGPGLIQVIGPNGAGKTTLFLAILGLLKPNKGRILIDEEDVTGSTQKLKGKVAYLPQRFEIPRNLPLTVFEFMECCMRLNSKWPRVIRREISHDRIIRALKLVGLEEEIWDSGISKLSGGQFQRLMIARTLMLETPIIILDEPLSNIDPEGRKTMADLFGEISNGKLLIISSHDPMLLMPYTSKILVLGGGQAYYGAPEEVVTKGVLNKIYGECLIEVKDHIHIVDWH
uniref:Metal ABC transporter ATP-binding protein n=1 Tax=Thermosphaera aggregans TaxID=54254 RepID=A0A7C2BL10_9CREN